MYFYLLYRVFSAICFPPPTWLTHCSSLIFWRSTTGILSERSPLNFSLTLHLPHTHSHTLKSVYLSPSTHSSLAILSLSLRSLFSVVLKYHHFTRVSFYCFHILQDVVSFRILIVSFYVVPSPYNDMSGSPVWIKYSAAHLGSIIVSSDSLLCLHLQFWFLLNLNILLVSLVFWISINSQISVCSCAVYLLCQTGYF